MTSENIVREKIVSLKYDNSYLSHRTIDRFPRILK